MSQKSSTQKGKATAKKPSAKAKATAGSKASNKATSTKVNETTKKVEWNTLGENNLRYIVNEKGFLIISVNLNKVYKPSKSFYNEGSKKKTNILVSSTGGNKKLLNGEYNNIAISVNIYRPMSKAEIEEWSDK